MIDHYYGFTRLPFTKDIPADLLFNAAGQTELCVRLDFLLKQRGLGLVTGETGSGKSTALRRFVATLEPTRHAVIYLSNPVLGLSGIYRDLLAALGHEPPFGKPKTVARIRTAFHELLHTKHRLPVVILDEAHLLPPTVFEPLRLLFSAEMDSQSLGVLLLVGQPELRHTLRLAAYEAFYQRITTQYHLPPLDLAQTIAYVRHQVQLSGYKAGNIFTDDALARIYEATKGVPRLINRLCDMALIVGMVEKKQILEESAIRKALADLEQG
jgi:type II secretory pathway predicted ATPase ExeA